MFSLKAGYYLRRWLTLFLRSESTLQPSLVSSLLNHSRSGLRHVPTITMGIWLLGFGFLRRSTSCMQSYAVCWLLFNHQGHYWPWRDAFVISSLSDSLTLSDNTSMYQDLINQNLTGNFNYRNDIAMLNRSPQTLFSTPLRGISGINFPRITASFTLSS